MSAPTPMNVLASEAKFLSVGAWCRLIPVSEIREWLDVRLREYDSPPTCLQKAALSICQSSSCFHISSELDALARDLGVAKLQPADMRRLLGWFGRAIDAKRLTPFDAGLALRWLVEHAPSTDHIIEEILAARERFRIRRCVHHRLKQAWRELREWCEYASLDPAAN